MYQQLIGAKKGDMEKTIEFLRSELGKLKTGRASVSFVEDLSVDYYGVKSPLKQVASLTVPDPRTIVISPWDKDNLVNIEKAINDSQLNLTPNNDGQVIRINIPSLTEERRKELVKVLNQKAEDARISIRKIREEVWEDIQNMTQEGKMGEDDKFAGKDKLQEAVDEFNKSIEEIRDKKEEEIMTI